MKKKLVLATTAAALLVTAYVRADEAKPDNEVSFNAALTSDYRYRGITQTRYKPAVQAGADYVNNPTGFYVGTWASSIKWIKDLDGDASVEWDIYAGKRGNFTEDFTYDVGVLTYIYPSNKLEISPNTTEIYGQLGYGPSYIKYSYSTTNLFGLDDTKGSGYLDIGSNIPLNDKLTLNLHAGHQEVADIDVATYEDWKIGLTYDFGVFTGSVAVVGTNADKNVYIPLHTNEFLGKTSGVVTISKVF